MNAPVTIPFWRWWHLVGELRRRGDGRRESGAFLLAPVNSRRISEFVCYDDLDPHALDSGCIRFDGRPLVKLWRYCEARSRRVVADVHTHPGDWVSQSDSDMFHPVVPVAGHLALILPSFASRTGLSLEGVGVHVYAGDGRWVTQSKADRFVQITLL